MAGGMRRGSLPMVYEALISALFIGIFIIATYPYIFEHADGSAYFSKFYSVDLATNAELVNAGYGDVVLRYDNLKQNLDLTFWFDNGVVLVSKLPSNLPLNSMAALIAQRPKNVDGQYYGKALRFPSGAVAITKPAFLVLRKADGAFAITEAETSFKECPAIAPAVQRKDAKLYLRVEGPKGPEAESRAKQLIAAMNIATASENDANIKIRLNWTDGATDTITIAPTSPDGRAYGCIFAKRLQAITLINTTTNTPSSSGTAFDTQITLTSAHAMTSEQVAQAIANALAVYYR